MPQVAVVAKLTAQQGKGEELLGVLSKLVDAAESEPGTLVYVLHAAQNEPDTVWFYELYTDADALATHSGSDTMRAVGAELAQLLAGRPEITRVEPRKAKGIPG